MFYLYVYIFDHNYILLTQVYAGIEFQDFIMEVKHQDWLQFPPLF